MRPAWSGRAGPAARRQAASSRTPARSRRHEHLLSTAEGRVRLLGAIQARRCELTEEERRALDFKHAQAAAQATVLGSRRASASDILSTAGNQPLPITAQWKREHGKSR